MITVLTPTFNRAHTLERLFDSLQRQTVINFEWLIIDDGSTDNTLAVFRTFSAKPNLAFSIRYKYQDNAGKHVALNTGCENANGDWIFIVDSDDAVTTDAIEQIYIAIDLFENPSDLGVAFRKMDFNGHVVGKNVDFSDGASLHPSTAGRLFGGDLAYVFSKRELLKLPFPVVPHEKFVPELFIWNLIGDRGRIIFYPSVSIYFCEYLEDGYSNNFYANLERNPLGFLLFYASQIARESSLMGKIKSFIRSIQCIYYCTRSTKRNMR